MNKSFGTYGRLLLLALTAALVSACTGDDPVSSVPTVASVEVSPGTASAASLDQTIPFSAVARDESGSPVGGVTFTWSSTVPSVATVSAAGVATAVGNGSALIEATAQGVVGSASLSVNQEPATATAEAGDGQSALAREPLALPLEVAVVDALSNPVSDVALTWSVLSGGGTVTGEATTDATGNATATWTMGPTQGPASVEASAGSASVTFTATALPNGVIQGTVTTAAGYLSRLAPSFELAAPTGPGPSASPKDAVAAAPSSPLRGPAGDAPVPGELLVRVRAGELGLPPEGASAYRAMPSAVQAAATLRQEARRWQATELLEVLGASPALLTVRVRVPPGQEDAVGARLLARPEVESVEPNGRMWAHGPLPMPGTSYVPAAAGDEPLFPRQAWHYDIIGAPFAWDSTTGSPNVIVAVVDDGIRFDHPDIADNLLSDGYDFVTEIALPACTSGSFTTSMDGDGPDPDPTIPASLAYNSQFDCVNGLEATGNHGLHVAGTIGASAGNGVGGVGVAWDVSIRPVRVLGSAGFGSYYDIAQGVLYAAGLPADDGAAGMVQPAVGADVINMSLGGSSGSTTLESAVQAAFAAGTLIVASAGNTGSAVPQYPASYDDVLSVSAVRADGSLASYSSFGSTVGIAAPGGQTSLGSDHGVVSLVWDFQNGLPTYQSWQGTSMAAPHVAGVAALVLSADPGLTVSQLRARLEDRAIDLGAAGPDNLFGAGLVFADGSVRDGAAAPQDTYVSVADAQDGTLHGPVATVRGGEYALDALPDGTYRVYVGQDRDGDLLTGYFDRRWGALGGSTTPTTVTVAQSSTESASFSFGYPIETEPNGDLVSADPLPVGGYAFGTVDAGGDADLYTFTVPSSTSFVIETDAFIGACGFADQVDTVIRLLDQSGVEIAENDDIDTGSERRCSRLTGTISAGTYFVEVTGWSGDSGYYALRIAEGS